MILAILILNFLGESYNLDKNLKISIEQEYLHGFLLGAGFDYPQSIANCVKNDASLLNITYQKWKKVNFFHMFGNNAGTFEFVKYLRIAIPNLYPCLVG